MNLTFRQLKVFTATFQLRSFSAAAEQEHLSQSAVSKLCMEIEEQVGFPLFDRSSRRVVPTEAANELYELSRDLLAMLEVTKRQMTAIRLLERGTVRIACSSIMMHGLITPALERFRGQHPDIRFELHELSADDTVCHVVEGKVDFGIASLSAPHHKLSTDILCDYGMFVIINAEHPFACRQSLTWLNLKGEQQISLRPIYNVRRRIDREIQRLGISIPSNVEVGTVMSSLSLVEAGLGIAILPGYVSSFVKKFNLISIPLVGTEMTHRLSLIRRRNTRLSPPAMAFQTMLKSSIPSVDIVSRSKDSH